MDQDHIQGKRARKAALAVSALCLLAMIAGICSCSAENDAAFDTGAFAGSAMSGAGESQTAQIAQIAGGSFAASIWDSLEQGDSFDDAVERAGFARIDESHAPTWFEDEIAPLKSFELILSDSDFTLFELQMTGTQENALDLMVACMVERDWTCAQSDMAGVATFSKSEGECRWAMLQCSETNGTCCMVLHIQRG